MILFAAGGGGLGQDAGDEDCAAELFVTDMTADTRALMLRLWAMSRPGSPGSVYRGILCWWY